MKARTKFTIITVLDAQKNLDVIVVGEDAGFIINGYDMNGIFQQLDTDKMHHIRPFELRYGFQISTQRRELFVDVDEDNGTIHDVDIGTL
jgi:hypothetical protein